MRVRHNHILELQSLRGLAAGVVLLHHGSFLFATTVTFHYWTEVLLNAHAAVMLFFVLSGYVLCRVLNVVDVDLLSLFRFYTTRLFRIYPAVWVACLIAFLYIVFLHRTLPIVGTSQWYTDFYPSPLSAKTLSLSFLSFNDALVPPMWSVKIELFASALLPFIAFAINRNVGLWLLGASAVFSFFSPFSSAVFLPSFVFGGLAFKMQDRLGRYFGNAPAIIAAALVMVFFRRVTPAWRFDVDYNAVVPVLVESAAAAVLIIGLVAHRWALLTRPSIVYLGDISYSLYLLHFTLMSVLAEWICRWPIGANYRALALMASTLVLTIPIASLTYETIEKPGIALGKKFIGLGPLRIGSKVRQARAL